MLQLISPRNKSNTCYIKLCTPEHKHGQLTLVTTTKYTSPYLLLTVLSTKSCSIPCVHCVPEHVHSNALVKPSFVPVPSLQDQMF